MGARGGWSLRNVAAGIECSTGQDGCRMRGGASMNVTGYAVFCGLDVGKAPTMRWPSTRPGNGCTTPSCRRTSSGCTSCSPVCERTGGCWSWWTSRRPSGRCRSGGPRGRLRGGLGAAGPVSRPRCARHRWRGEAARGDLRALRQHRSGAQWRWSGCWRPLVPVGSISVLVIVFNVPRRVRSEEELPEVSHISPTHRERATSVCYT